MALPNVTVNKLSGGTGRPLAGFDYYSGMVAYGTAPSSWVSYSPGGLPSGKIKKFFSPKDAEDAGILPYTENTAPTGTIAWGTGSSLGTLATGDIITITVPVPNPNSTTTTVTLCAYTVVSADVTDATGATLNTAITAAITALTYSTGFSATAATNVTTISAPKTVGKALNTVLPVVTLSAHTMTNTIVAFSAGTASQYAIWKYHIIEYFRIQPQGVLYFGVFTTSTSYNEVKTVQSFALGQCRQIGVYDNSATTGLAANITGTITLLQTVKAALDISTAGQKAPISILYSPNIVAVTDLSTYPNQQLNTASGVSCVISQDGAADGAQLYVNNVQSIGSIGCTLGAVSLAAVNESIAWPQKFNMSNGVENNVPAFANGKLTTEVTDGLQSTLDSYRYIFFRTFTGTVVGTYFNADNTCITQSSDYAYINDNRTMDKVARIMYASLVPLLSSPIILNNDGTMKNYSIATFINASQDAVIAAMITGKGNSPEISGIQCIIDPAQKINVTNNLVISAMVVEDGTARNITVNVGYGTIA